MATLYEMTQQATELYDMLQSGEIDEQVMSDTMELMMVPEKLEGYCQVIRQLTVDADAYAAEEKRLSDKKAAAKKGVDRLKARMADFLQASGQSKMDCGLFAVRLTKGESVQLDDERVIPREYYDPQPDKLSKSRIKAAIKTGTEVPGASIIVGYGCAIK